MTAEERPLDPHGRVISSAVFADNWWVILLIDAMVGLAVVAIGVGLAVWWTPMAGVPVVVAGVAYVVLVGRRGLQWRWLRREAGRS